MSNWPRTKVTPENAIGTGALGTFLEAMVQSISDDSFRRTLTLAVPAVSSALLMLWHYAQERSRRNRRNRAILEFSAELEAMPLKSATKAILEDVLGAAIIEKAREEFGMPADRPAERGRKT